MKKIMYIFEARAIGGAAQSLLDILNKVIKYVKAVVVLQPNSPIIDSLKSKGIAYYEVDIPVDMSPQGKIILEGEDIFVKSYQSALKIADIIDSENIDIVHINSSVSYSGAIAAMMRNKPIVWHIRELIEEQFEMTFYNCDLRLELFKQANKIITISDYVHNEYLKKYDIDSIRLYNGIEKKRYKYDLLQKKSGENIFLVAGMITPFKGQGDVIRAAEILAKKNIRDFKVFIVGGGDEFYIWTMKRYIIEHSLQNYIEVVPFCNDLSEYRKNALFSITSSQNEALGRVTIEPMLAGNLVIGAKSGGTIELIGENEERGIFYELGNYEDLAQKMEKVINMPIETRKEILSRAQKFAEEQFDTDIYVEKLITIYEECLNNRKSADNSILKNMEQKYLNLKEDSVPNENISEDKIYLSLIKSQSAFKLAIKWIEIKQRGHNLAEYFLKKNIFEIAVYGISELGRKFYDEIYDSGIKIQSVVDRNLCLKNNMIKIDKNVDVLDKRMVIVVTVAASEKDIIRELKEKGYVNTIGLSEVLNSF